MPNQRLDISKKSVTVSHPNLGDIVVNEHLRNIISEPVSDTEEIGTPGFGGGRTVKNMVDKSRKITIEVNIGSQAEFFMRRMLRYKNTEFSINWSDESSAAGTQGGQGEECFAKDVSNDRSAETISFEITSLNYSGD